MTGAAGLMPGRRLVLSSSLILTRDDFGEASDNFCNSSIVKLTPFEPVAAAPGILFCVCASDQLGADSSKTTSKTEIKESLSMNIFFPAVKRYNVIVVV
jgi:hypothetical protein